MSSNLKQVKDPEADSGWLVVVGPKLDIVRNEWGEVTAIRNEQVGSYWKSPWKRNEWWGDHRGESLSFRTRKEAKHFAFTGEELTVGSGKPQTVFESRRRRELRRIIRNVTKRS